MARKKTPRRMPVEVPPPGGRAPIVADFMTQVVVTLPPETSVQEAIDLFTRRHISAAPVVSGDGAILGVVSATDVLRAESSDGSPERESAFYSLDDEPSGSLSGVAVAVAQGGRTVLEIATRRVVGIDERATLAEAARVLLELGIRRLLVTRQGKFAGILTSTDIVKWVAQPALEAARAKPRPRGRPGRAR